MAFRDLIPWSREENRFPVTIGAPSERDERRSLFSLHREMNRLFDDVFRGFDLPAFGGFGRAFDWPRVELNETEREIRVTAELPGLEEKDVEVLIEEGVLTLRGEKKCETKDLERGYSERSYGRFERRIGLPRGLEQDKANAAFRNGVLTVTLPRSADAVDNVRRIPIDGGIRH
jgi:HSP20 family protein